MKKIILSLLTLALLSNCVSTKLVPLPADFSSVKNKTILAQVGEKPGFADITFSQMLSSELLTGGLLGPAIMIHSGNKIIEENEVEDPASLILANLSKDLEKNYDSTIINLGVGDKKEESLSKEYPNANYLLDVKTVNWTISYLPVMVNKFRLIYSTKLTLTDIKTSQIVAEGFCSRIPPIKNSFPTHDQLLANKAQLLKNELTKSADDCSKVLREAVLNLPTKQTVAAVGAN